MHGNGPGSIGEGAKAEMGDAGIATVERAVAVTWDRTMRWGCG